MDQEWNQVFAMIERVSVTNKVSEFGILKPSYKCILSGMLICSNTSQILQTKLQTKLFVAHCAIVCSKTPPNLIIICRKVVNQENRVMKAMSEIMNV